MEQKVKRKYEMDMCTGSLLPKILIFAIPLMASSLLQLLFNAADIIVVGRFAGDDSLAAVGSTSSIVNLLVNLFVGLSVGANVLTARYFGAKKSAQLSKTIHTAMTLAIVGGIFLALVGFFGARTIMELMKSPPEVIDKAALYLKLYFLGMPANLIYNGIDSSCNRRYSSSAVLLIRCGNYQCCAQSDFRYCVQNGRSRRCDCHCNFSVFLCCANSSLHDV